MKKRSPRRRGSSSVDDLRPEYDFDYSKARPNPYAARLRGPAVTVVLDPDVAAAFPTSQAVNATLRKAVPTVPRRARSRRGRTGGRRQGKERS